MASIQGKILGQPLGLLLFLTLPVLYFLLLGFHGFADTDQGFVPGLAHRILQGERMYRDFNYVRPPLTPYLHAAVMWLLPHSLFMVGSRALFYLTIWAYTGLAVLTLDKQFDLDRLGIPKWLLACLGFVFSVHNYPAMPWHTTDGLFFSILGIYLITTRDGMLTTILGLVSLYLSALTKQPFGLMPLLGAALVVYLRPQRRTWVAVGIAGLLCGVATLGLVKLFPEMLRQISGSSKLSDLVTTGFRMYLKPLLLVLLPVLVGVWGLKRLAPENLFREVTGWICLLLPSAWLLGQYYIVEQAGDYTTPIFWFYHLLLLFGVCWCIMNYLRERRKELLVFLLLCVPCWLSGISWGYTVPALFALPGLFALIYVLTHELKFIGTLHVRSLKRLLAPVLVLFSTILFIAISRHPYRDKPRPELTFSAGEVFPGMSHIRTSHFGYHKLVEFKSHYHAFGDPYVVLPAMPLAHFLTQSSSPIGVDWAYDIEIGSKDVDRFIDKFSESAPTVFVEKARMEESAASSLLGHVLTHWTAVDTGEYFVVYRQPTETQP
ncbi:MAG: hypothetical protein U0176_01750 [Bacteroidia bacterium]